MLFYFNIFIEITILLPCIVFGLTKSEMELELFRYIVRVSCNYDCGGSSCMDCLLGYFM